MKHFFTVIILFGVRTRDFTMDNICPFSKTSEEKHAINMCSALEHMTKCKSRVRCCDVPSCSFLGNKLEMDVHHVENVVQHNHLLAREHYQIVSAVKNKEEAAKDYARVIDCIWSKSWTIDEFQEKARQATSMDIPLASNCFRKNGHVWRILLFPSKGEVFLQLMSSPDREQPLNVKATIAVEDNAYSFPPETLKEKEMIGGKLQQNGSKLNNDEVEVKVVATSYKYVKQTKSKSENNEAKETTEEHEIQERLLVEFVNNMERDGEVKEIILQAKEECKHLPLKIGRGGKAGKTILEKMGGEAKKNVVARINAADHLATLVDDIVVDRYDEELAPIRNLLDRMYDNNSDQSAFDRSEMSFRLFASIRFFVSGAIIRKFIENQV